MTNADDLGAVQKARKIAIGILALCGAGLMLLFSPMWGHAVHRHIEAVGLLLLAICIVGRSVSSLYISGYKNAHLVDSGPYSICRNPLYTSAWTEVRSVFVACSSLLARFVPLDD